MGISQYPAATSGTQNISPADFVFSFSGTLVTNQNSLIPKLAKDEQTSVKSLEVYVQTAPTGSSAIFTFLKNGVSIGTVTVAAAATSGITVLTPAVTINAFDIMTAQITQIGTSIPGTTATMIARVS